MNLIHLRPLVYQAFIETDILTKIALVKSLHHDLANHKLSVDPKTSIIQTNGDQPGMPALQIVRPAHVPKRGFGSIEGKAALVHAIAHIEFNAINLALDAIWRFENAPDSFYRDWLQVAFEEANHFELLQSCLAALGYQYGDLSVHEGLWEIAEKSKHHVLERMALVPRILEARGLDVTPTILTKLRYAKADGIVAALEVILREEHGHVAIGNRWFYYFCEQQGFITPEQTHHYFIDLCVQHQVKPPRPPFNKKARLKTGFFEQELEQFSAWHQHNKNSNNI